MYACVCVSEQALQCVFVNEGESLRGIRREKGLHGDRGTEIQV